LRRPWQQASGGFARGFAGGLVTEWVNHFTFTRGLVALLRDTRAEVV
jgi:hypothetical protein